MNNKKVTVGIDLGLYASAQVVLEPTDDTDETIIQEFYTLLAIGEITPQELHGRFLSNLDVITKKTFDQDLDSWVTTFFLK